MQRAITPADLDRSAFNAAFYELGLRWHWDGPTWDALAAEPCERTRVSRYIEAAQSHLLRAYDADFLADAILAAQRRCREALATSACLLPPGFKHWIDPRRGEVGI